MRTIEFIDRITKKGYNDLCQEDLTTTGWMVDFIRYCTPGAFYATVENVMLDYNDTYESVSQDKEIQYMFIDGILQGMPWRNRGVAREDIDSWELYRH